MDSGSEDTKQETTRKKVVKERCSGTGWICQLCVFNDSDGPKAGESFESLISHFNSLEHSFVVSMDHYTFFIVHLWKNIFINPTLFFFFLFSFTGVV